MNTMFAKGLFVVAVGALLLGCGKKEEQVRQIGFKTEVQPILQQYCTECHKPGGEGTAKSGLDMSSYEALMKGTKFGPVVKPGDSLSSALNMLVEGRADPSIKMPHGRESLPADKIAILKNWVQQGAKNN
jgi:hypothetical protein